MKIKEISLKPYSGRLFVAKTKKDYERAHKKLFRIKDVIFCDSGGKFTGGAGKDDLWTYLVWADNIPALAHELSHVVLHIFERCGIDPRESGGEPFCYMLQYLMEESLF